MLATDEDREGESIGWHLLEVLKPKQPVRRMVFHEITREAIDHALHDTRAVDMDLVHAQETRRILDRLVGYTVSPLLWRKIAPKLSAGRVQSVAVRLLVLRERERRAFVAGSYWDLKALLNKRPDQPSHRFEATLVSVGDKRVATGRDFDEHTGQIAAGKDVLLLNQQEAEALRDRLLRGTWRITDVEEKDAQRSPYAPFTTSTLQQEANRKLGMSAQRNHARRAKALREWLHHLHAHGLGQPERGGDQGRARGASARLYGEEYLSPSPRRYQTKTANAQEAHEAIRPAGDQMHPGRQPAARRQGEGALRPDLEAHDRHADGQRPPQAAHRHRGRRRCRLPRQRPAGSLCRLLPRLRRGLRRPGRRAREPGAAAAGSWRRARRSTAANSNAVGHETKPPARYTEATLVKALEAEGIGRPSTYATIIDTIQERGYVFKQRKELVPTFTAFAVTELLEKHFDELVDLKFTANMEQRLDDISNGDLNYLTYLTQFYLGESGLENQVKTRESEIDPRLASTVDLSNLNAEVRIGQYGPFVAREENGDRRTVSLPPNLPPADLTDALVEDLLQQEAGRAAEPGQ